MNFQSNRLFTAGLLVAGFAAGALVTARLMEPDPAQAAASSRVYELRTYTTLEGRLPALEKNFREHITKLFEKHGMQNVGYWIPRDEPLHSKTLIYVLSHESNEAATKSWAAFQADPEWIKVRTASEADGKIIEKIERVFMVPTDFSALH